MNEKRQSTPPYTINSFIITTEPNATHRIPEQFMGIEMTKFNNKMVNYLLLVEMIN